MTADTDRAASSVSITVTPDHPLVDERLHIEVSGLPPLRSVSVAAQTRAQDGLWWRSRGTFVSDARGDIDLETQAPVSGSYKTADVMGLFWSMSPDVEPAGAEHAYFDVPDPSKPTKTQLEVRDGARVLAVAHVVRGFAKPGIRVSAVSDGMTGILYRPDDGLKHPAVLVIGGSDGGFGAPNVAMLLASHGFVTLSIAYFGAKALPSTLEGIPMETFSHAVAWLRRQSFVEPRFVAIYGESRGSEPALWTAAKPGGADAVIARSPSFALWGGITANHFPGAAAWTETGTPLAYIPNRVSVRVILKYIWDLATGTPVRQTPIFLENLNDFGDTTPTEIPVENIRGPILLLAGNDDQIWPSALMAHRIMSRLERHHHQFADQLLAYDDVGHPIPYVHLPLAGDRSHARFAVGGTVDGSVKAQADAWPKLVAFLQAAAQRSLSADHVSASPDAIVRGH